MKKPAVKTKSGGEVTQLMINSVEVKPIVRQTSDIDRWRNALKAADKGKRKDLYGLYEDILLDNVLSNAIAKRIMAITNAELTFTRGDEAVPEMDDLMDTPGFEKLLSDIMLSLFWGISVDELEFTEDGLMPHNLPRRNLLPAFGEVALKEGDERGIPYRDNPFVLEVDHGDFGLILKAAPYAIYKRGNMGDWAQYAEVFGMPIRVFEYDMFDEQARVELTRAAERSGSNPLVVLPKGSAFRVEPGAASGTGEVYDNLRTACNEEILIGILGQTMTTVQGDKGGARSLGEIHMQVQEDIHKADRRFVQRVLNTRLLPMLESRGYPVSDGFFYFVESGETVSLTDRMALTREAAQMVPVSAQYVYETFGIPRPEEDEELVETSEPMFGPPAEPGGDDEPPTRGGIGERVRNFFVQAPGTGAIIGADSDLSDTEGDSFDTRLAKRVARGEAAYFDPDLFREIAGGLLGAFHQGWRGRGGITNSGVDYGVVNEVVQTAMETNLYHFSAGKTLVEIQKLNQAYRASTSFSDYMQRSAGITSTFNKRWAQTEYNTAGLIAESTATYHRLKAQRNLFPYWEYRTVDDGKVRAEHVRLHGLILPCNDPRWDKIYPPNGWGCRCYVVPRMAGEFDTTQLVPMRKQADAFFDTREYKVSKANGFGVNRADLGQVFTANQQYIRKFPNKAAKYLDRLGATDYNLPTVTKSKAAAEGELPRYEGTAQEWFDSRQQKGAITLADRLGRQVALLAANFQKHTADGGKYARRVEYLKALPEALSDPDEVWINAEKGKAGYENYTVIKYYQNEVLVVCCRLAEGKINEVRTWFPLAEKKIAEEHHRRGLLVYKKASR